MAIENTYCKIDDDGNVLKYPYTFREMREDNPNRSVPRKILRSEAINFNAAPVVEGSKPNHDKKTQKLRLQTLPTFNGTEYILEYEVVDLTADERTALEEKVAKQMREMRDKLLAESDYIIIKNTEKGLPISQEWRQYRQSLRDMPDDPNWPWEAGYNAKPSE